MSKEKRASTSVETFPGTICRISFPNSTSRRSSVESIFSSKSLPCVFHCQYVQGVRNLSTLTWSLPYSTAMSISLAYSGFLDAARMREGFVVASCGLYFPMVAKSPESQTTVVPMAFNWSRELDMTFVLFCMGYISYKKVVVEGCKMVELREKKSHYSEASLPHRPCQ